MPGIDARRGFVEDDDAAPGRARSGDHEALLLASRQAQGVPISQVSEVEVGQELLPRFTAGIRRADRQLALERVGEKLTSGVLHDKRTRGAPLPAIRLLAVQGDRSGSGAGQTAQHAHEGRLPHPVHARDARDTADWKVRVEAFKHGRFSVGEAQVPAGQAHAPTSRGLGVGIARGHPGLRRSGVHEGTQAERLAFVLAHRVELCAGPSTRERPIFHQEDLVGEPAQEVEAVLDDDDCHPLFFEDRQGAAHVRDGVGVQVRCRFVGEEDRGPGCQRAGEGDLLELPTRQC